jgi:hypothetical protein
MTKLEYNMKSKFFMFRINPLRKRLFLFALLLGIRSVNSQVCFALSDSFAVGIKPFGIVSADFDKDGKQDLATANFNSNNVSILLGSGNGNFSAATHFPVGTAPGWIIVADFNGDNNLDLANTNFFSDDVSILLGTGTGTFANAVNYTTGNSTAPKQLISKDFNMDGKLDLVVTDASSNNQLSVLLGTGTGSFSAPMNFTVVPMGDNPIGVASADFNGDNIPDLATANWNLNYISVIFGNGIGGFGPASTFPLASSAISITSADFNGDNKADLVVSTTANEVSVLLGVGNGTFGAPISYTVGMNPRSVNPVDFNGDSKLDIATCNQNSGDISVLLGTGTGSFSTATSFTVNLPTLMTNADFNGDSKIDLATTNPNTNIVNVLLNCTPLGIGDVNPGNIAILYPNPTTGRITIGGAVAEKQMVEIFDASGKLMLTHSITGEANIDVSALSEGIYTVRISTKTGITNKKLVIKR